MGAHQTRRLPRSSPSPLATHPPGRVETTRPCQLASTLTPARGALQAKGFDVLDELGCCAVTLQSVEEGDVAPLLEGGALGETSHCVRASLVPVSGLRLIPLTATRTLAKVVLVADPKLPVVPEWLLNFVLKVVSPWVFWMTQRLLANLPPQYRERIAANPMYELIR